ncbi:unnamed protein product, partial [Rotaria magnacalcarata]
MSYFNREEALALSQRVIGLYTLSLNASTVQLNVFARRALSKLTATFDPELYEGFLDAWGTHIITKSLLSGMIEERAKVMRCSSIFGNNSIENKKSNKRNSTLDNFVISCKKPRDENIKLNFISNPSSSSSTSTTTNALTCSSPSDNSSTCFNDSIMTVFKKKIFYYR